MYKKLNANKDGFTIIEVLIVLAIAGLIMVIVFLAVPSLQRNNRNTQRDSDAQRILAAVNECVANNNGQITSCTNPNATQLNNYITATENQQLTTFRNAGVQVNAVDQFDINTSEECNAAGNASTGGAPARSFVVLYNVETNNTPQLQCIGG